MSQHTPDPSAAASPHASAAASDRAGHIETHGVDVIPDPERHGRPRELFWIWMSANVVYLYFVLGGVLVLLGLSIWEALAITVIGNLWWAAVGWLAVSGPASGTPSVAIMRAMFGIRGNRVFGGGLGVAIGLFYEIINIAVATLAANALLGILGVPLPGVEIGIAASAITLGAMIVMAARPPLWVAGALVALFAVFHGYAHGAELPESANPISYAAGFVIATGALHLLGIALGVMKRWRAGGRLLRATGALIAATGAWFLLGHLGA